MGNSIQINSKVTIIFSSVYKTQKYKIHRPRNDAKIEQRLILHHILSHHHVCSPDLSVGLFSVVPDIAWKFAVTWEAGLVACKLIK